MIILDYSGIAAAVLYAGNVNPKRLEEGIIRHMILNSIRMYNTKFRKKYGEMVIACDGGSLWRKEIYPQYKANRAKSREENKDGIDWDEFYRISGLVLQELRENFPYKVIQLPGCEADDIIATLCADATEFGNYQDVMICSADKDFIQLQTLGNVKQFSTKTKKLIEDSNPDLYRFEHILRGDSGDGVPNVLSGDTTFVDGSRQTPLTKKKIEAWFAEKDNLEKVMPSEIYRNFKRNKAMIDLVESIPSGVKENIVKAYISTEPASQSRIFNYLISKRCSMLIECCEEFFSPKK